MAKLHIWIGFGNRRGDAPVHWMILVAPKDQSKSTWYHVTGGPTHGTEYKLKIQSEKRFDSLGISERHFVGELDEKDQNKLKASAKKIPVQRCQEWTVSVLQDLERKGLVPTGTAEYWFHQVELSPFSTDGYHGIPEEASSSAAGSTQASASAAPNWVWDDASGQYQYWDAAAGRWVAASETGQ